jgi:hypothetical protein
MIEAVESTDGRCLGVQFHPEMDFSRNEDSRRIFGWLVTAAAKTAGLPAPERAKARKHRKPTRPADAPQLTLDDAMTTTKRKRKTVQRGVVVSYVCRECGLRFDKEQDRDDHEYWICGDPVARTTEPPPGHPDWLK